MCRWRVGGEEHGAFEEGRGCCQPTPGLCPSGGSFELGGDLLIRTDHRLGAVPGPPVGVGGRVGDVGQRPVQLVPALGGRRPVGRRADQRMPELHPDPELDQPGLDRRRRGLHREAEPARRPADQEPGPRWGRRPPAEAAVGSVPAVPPVAGESCPRSAPISGAARGRPNPPASSVGVNPRGSSSSARGFPCVSATIRSRTRTSSGAVRASIEQRARVLVGQPLHRSSGRPASSGPRTRAASTMPIGSTASRRAANPSACADARSSHCSSSTMQSSGRPRPPRPAGSSTASPTRNRSGAGPVRTPNAVRSAFRCGPGSPSR